LISVFNSMYKPRVLISVVRLNMLLGLLLLLPLCGVNAQCPGPQFSLELPACLGQPLEIENTSTGAVDYAWDFCDGSILNTPTGSMQGVLTTPNTATAIATVREENNFYSFFASSGNNKIIRVKLDGNLKTPTDEFYRSYCWSERHRAFSGWR
jgi:hypothetical protein